MYWKKGHDYYPHQNSILSARVRCMTLLDNVCSKDAHKRVV